MTCLYKNVGFLPGRQTTTSMDPADVARRAAGRKHLISPIVQEGFKRTSSSELHKPGKQLIQQLQQQLQLQIISAVSA